MKTKLLIALSVVFLAPLRVAASAPPQTCDTVGTVTLLADRTLQVSYPGAIPPFLVHPDQAAYQGYLDYAGELSLGETKTLRRREAVVEMKADRTIAVAGAGSTAETGPELLAPGSLRYAEILRRLGGMEPGQSKILFPPDC